MAMINHIDNGRTSTSIEVCPSCGKKFNLITEEQEAGFRMKDELICPYCNYLIKSSMEVEYSARKIEE